MTWQPIETAPKEFGDYIMLGKAATADEPGWRVEGRWSEYGEGWYELNNDPTDAWGGALEGVTHWQPLPEPPTE